MQREMKSTSAIQKTREILEILRSEQVFWKAFAVNGRQKDLW
jgi:hypothetical protein